jgi:hypothetical protein
MKVYRRLDPAAFFELAASQGLCAQCLNVGRTVHHRTSDFHVKHAARKTDQNICITVVFLLALLLGVSWLTQWKRTVWLFLPMASETP